MYHAKNLVSNGQMPCTMYRKTQTIANPETNAAHKYFFFDFEPNQAQILLDLSSD